MIRITTVTIYKVLNVTVYVGGGEAMEGIIFITAAEMAEILAYKIIKQLNEELEAKGFITIPGRISKKYFEEKFYGVETA